MENDTQNNDSRNIKKSGGNICFEQECNDILQNNAVFLFNCSTDDGWAILESGGGSFIASYGMALALGIATLPVSAPVVATIAVASIIVGVALMADSHGILSGQATDEDWNKFYTDLLMVPIGLGLSKGISIAGNALFKQMTGKTISIAALETTHEIKGFLYAMNNVVSDNINYARDLIIVF